MENTLVQKKNPWLLIISIGAFVKAFITLVIGLLMIVLGDPKITNIIFIIYNMLYIVAGDIFVGLATLAFHKQKDNAKKYLKIASMIYFIGFNVVVILLLLSIVIYLIKLVLNISGSQIGQFFASLGILIFALVIFVIIVLAIYTFFGSIHRFSKDEENKNGAKTIAVLPVKPYAYYREYDAHSGTELLINTFYQLFEINNPDEEAAIRTLRGEIENGLAKSPYIKLINSDEVELAQKKGYLNPF